MPKQTHNLTADPLIAGGSLLARLVAAFLADGQYRALRPDSLRFYTFTLHGFLSWLDDEDLPHEPANLTAAHLKAFFVYLRSGARSESTLHAYGRALRAFFNWCVAEGHLSANPMTGPDPHRPRVALPKVADPRIQPFTPEQIQALLKVCDLKTPLGCRDQALVYFLLDTGCRASEVCGLRLADYDATAGTWAVQGAKTGQWRRGRLPPVSRRALARWLVNYRPRYGSPPETVFVGLSDKDLTQLTPNGLHQCVARLGRLAGLQGVRCSPHTFRHTFALFYLLEGGDPATLQLLLGHSTLKMTMRYLHFADADLAALAGAHAPSARLTRKG